MRRILPLMLAMLLMLALSVGCSSKQPLTELPIGDGATADTAEGGDQLYQLSFSLTNNTTVALTDIRIKASSGDDWGENILPEGYIVPDGTTVDITSEYTGAAGETFDLYTNDEVDDSYEYINLNMTEISAITLFVEYDADGKVVNNISFE